MCPSQYGTEVVGQNEEEEKDNYFGKLTKLIMET